MHLFWLIFLYLHHSPFLSAEKMTRSLYGITLCGGRFLCVADTLTFCYNQIDN